MYIELHSRSAFSFLEGASVPEEFAEICSSYEMPAMAMLDRDGVYGAPRFHLAMEKLKKKAHIGAEVTSLLPLQKRTAMLHQQLRVSRCYALPARGTRTCAGS